MTNNYITCNIILYIECCFKYAYSKPKSESINPKLEKPTTKPRFIITKKETQLCNISFKVLIFANHMEI